MIAVMCKIDLKIYAYSKCNLEACISVQDKETTCVKELIQTP